MAEIKLYNVKCESQGNISLSSEIFAVPVKASVVHQVYTAMRANARLPWAESKGKGEVRGGGKKPWKQKGTGRARHGSIRSPLWKGGGVTFGPRNERNFEQKINKKMSLLATKMCLSDKVSNNKLIVLEDFSATGKTKELAVLRQVLPGAGYKTLWLFPEKDEKLIMALRNLPKLTYKAVKDLNVVDLLSSPYVILTKKGIEKLEKRLS